LAVDLLGSAAPPATANTMQTTVKYVKRII